MGMYTKKYSIQLSEICFYVFFAVLLFAKGIGLYDGQTLFKIFLLTAMAGWLGKQLLTEYALKEAVMVILLFLLGILIYLNTHEKGALFCILLVTAMKGINIKRAFQIGLVTWILSFAILFILTSLHIVDSSFKVHDKLGLGRIIRWSLGYAHPNVLHVSYLVLVCFVVYLLQDRFRAYWFLVLEAINIYVFMYSLSSTGFIAVTICLILALYWRIRKKFCGFEKFLIQLCMPFCLLMSLVAPVILKEPLFSLVNKIVNNRLVLSQWFLQNQKVKLFGVDTREIVTSLRTMDNSYVFAYITYGVVFCILCATAYAILINRKAKEQDGVALCVILSCLIAGITEPFLFNTSFKNLSLLFVGEMIFTLKGCEKKYSVLGKLDKKLEISFPDLKKILREMENATMGHRKTLIVAAIIFGILAGVISYQSTLMPERYILPRTAFEMTNDIKETYHLKSEGDLPQEGDIVLGYVDEETDMVPFSGNIAAVERFRNTIAAVVYTTLVVFAAGNLYWWIKSKRKDGTI